MYMYGFFYYRPAYIFQKSLLELTSILGCLGKLWQFSDQTRGLLVVGSQREDALIGGVGLLLTGH